MKNRRVPLPSQAELRMWFDYEPATGLLRHRVRADRSPQWNGRRPGCVAGSRHSNGYVELRFDGLRVLAHRVIWKWLYGTEPDELDHRNLVRCDNREDNLRVCGHDGNMQNTRGWSKKPLPKGVHLRRESGRYRAIICFARRNRNIGTFDTIGEAQAAYAAAAAHFHHEFARTA